MEMQGVVVKEDTRLGNFFRTWGKEFSSTKIFDKTNGTDGKVRMFVNGKENKDFENYKMHESENYHYKPETYKNLGYEARGN